MDNLVLQKIAADVARLLVNQEKCEFPGTTFEEKRQHFLGVMRPLHFMSYSYSSISLLPVISAPFTLCLDFF
jgi:hypothetical protein